MIKITAAELLNYAIDESNLSVEVIARKYGVSQGSLYMWKKGKYGPKYDDLYGLLEFMGFDLAELTIKLRLIRNIETMRFIK